MPGARRAAIASPGARLRQPRGRARGRSSSRCRASASTASRSRRAAAAAGASVHRRRRGRAACRPGARAPAWSPSPIRWLALGELASAVRARFAGRVVGVTGSNGKTTTKELVAAALRPARARCCARRAASTPRSACRVTILSATGNEAFWVLEMAMRGRGEIALLARIARPHIGVITNVSGAHLERLGSIEEVAHAKGELFAGSPRPDGSGGIAVLPAGDPLDRGRGRQRRDPAPSVASTSTVAAAATCTTLRGDPRGRRAAASCATPCARVPVVVRLPLAGAHNARNGAAALARRAGGGRADRRPRRARSRRSTLPPHRSAVIAAGGRTILDDCYNANPASMRAALASIASSAGGGARGSRSSAT